MLENSNPPNYFSGTILDTYIIKIPLSAQMLGFSQLFSDHIDP